MGQPSGQRGRAERRLMRWLAALLLVALPVWAQLAGGGPPSTPPPVWTPPPPPPTPSPTPTPTATPRPTPSPSPTPTPTPTGTPGPRPAFYLTIRNTVTGASWWVRVEGS